MRAFVLTIAVAVLAAVSPWGPPAAAQGRAATDRPEPGGPVKSQAWVMP